MPLFCLGVIVYIRQGRFEEGSERRYFQEMTRLGQTLGINLIFLPPWQKRNLDGKLMGFRYLLNEKRWSSGDYSRPQLLLDRYRVLRSPLFHHYLRFRKEIKIPILNNRMGNKWLVHRILSADQEMVSHLPETHLIESSQQLIQMMQHHRRLFIKPINGTGGRHILQVSKQASHFSIHGRSGTNSLIHYPVVHSAHLLSLLRHLLPRERKFIVQQGINLGLLPRSVIDFRLLLQKDGQGEWKETAIIGKVAPHSHVTTNLHGGGRAMWADQFLKRHFTAEQYHHIRVQLQRLGVKVPLLLENHFGSLVELGVDVGIDVNGHCWIIEVNPKPGRVILQRMGRSIYEKTTLHPLLYARYAYENLMESEDRNITDE